MSTVNAEKRALMSTLPGDDVRQIMWRFADRYDLQMVIQSTRSVARGVVARMVADKQRHTHEWTPEKAAMLKAFDEAGITAAFMEPEQGGYISGPKNLVLAMIAFELAQSYLEKFGGDSLKETQRNFKGYLKQLEDF